MERLEIKTIKGKQYLYYSVWGKVDGKCRRLWQRYVGSAKTVLELTEKRGKKRTIKYAQVFHYGLPISLYQESVKADVIKAVDDCCPKRKQGLSTGTYIAVAAINRAFGAVSKQKMWEWFSKTSLIRCLPHVKEQTLSSQQFWNHMNKISSEDCTAIWNTIITKVVKNESIDLSSISYDGTNYYTFIDTFNMRCSIAKRGNNKQGRAGLRQVNYALFCTADGNVPLLYDVYEGGRPAVTQFPLSLERFETLFQKLTSKPVVRKKTTLIFDKGNCSHDNYLEIDKYDLHFVTSTKLDDHKELTFVPNTSKRFVECPEAELEGTKSFRASKLFHGKERTMVVSFNANLFHLQQLTLQGDIEKALDRLYEIQQILENRAKGIVRGGIAPTRASIEKRCDKILAREYLEDVIKYSISENKNLSLSFSVDERQLKKITNTYLGKNIIVTSREEWTDSQIIKAYRSQYLIEEVFKESKDRQYGTWWPQFHWTDNNIHVHGLYCTISLLLRSLIWHRVNKAGMKISMARLLNALNDIQEVVNIYDAKSVQTVLTMLSEEQKALANVLGLSLTNHGND